MITGDYVHRKRGLEALYRPRDLLDYDVHRAECIAGVVGYVPDSFRAPYACLAALANQSGVVLGSYQDPVEPPPPAHPCLYLWSGLQLHGFSGYMPPLVVSAYEELKSARVLS